MKKQLPNLRIDALICLALVLISLALYLPSLRHEFLIYDDQQYVTENTHVRAGLTGPGLVWAFGCHAGNWHPLTWLSHMLDCQFYGVKPAGHHLTNVLLHLANTALLFLALRRMTGAVWRSALVAALFAWHPLHVESVAWIAERKDVLSAFFFMLTLLAYARYAEGRRRKAECRMQNAEFSSTPHLSRLTFHASRFYLLTLSLFALALLSKPMVVTLPFVLLLLDYWPLRRLQFPALQSSKFKVQSSRFKVSPTAGMAQPSDGRQAAPFSLLFWEKLPFIALTVIGCITTVHAQQPAIVSTAGLGILRRLMHALVSYLHYLGALCLPRHLAVFYPYQTAAVEIIPAGLLLVALTILAFRFASRRPYLATGWLWFLGMLVPVIGLVQVGDQAWADRYSYLPSIGLFIIVVWGLSDLAEAKPVGHAVLRGLAVAVGLGLSAGTSMQLRYWQNTRTLFEHAAAVTTNNPLATTLLGSLLAKEGKLDQAMEYYRAALRIQPRFPEAQFFLANALDQQGKLDEAIALYQKALWFKPSQAETHIFLGAALAKQKKYEEAAAHDRAALKLNPESAVAHNNLARVLHVQGRLDDAIAHYSAAIKLDPNLAEAHNNLGVLLLQKGQLAEGVVQLRDALRLKPGDLESQLNLAQALVQQEQWSEAAGLFARTVTAATANPNAHCQFAIALAHLHKTREAMSHYASALLLQQDFPAALDGLSWILATAADPQLRNGPEAVRMAERACELTGRKDPTRLKTLAAAYAETGRFPEAITSAQAAHDLAAQADRKELANVCQLMLEQFNAAKPWREQDDPKVGN